MFINIVDNINFIFNQILEGNKLVKVTKSLLMYTMILNIIIYYKISY